MSAPETKAWSPAPVTTTTRIAGSFSKSSRMTGIASHMSDEVALRLAGLLKTSRPTGPAFSAIMFGVGLIICTLLFAGARHSSDAIFPLIDKDARLESRAPSLDHATLAEARDGRGVVAGFLQHRLGVLALLWRGRTHLEGRAAHVDRLAYELDRPKLGRRHGMRHLEVLDLRIGEHLVHLVDRPGRDARLVQLLDQLGAAVGRNPLVDLGVQHIAVLGARLVGRETLVGHQLRRLDAFTEALVDVAARRRDVDVAVLGLEHAGWDRGRMVVAGLARDVLGQRPARRLEVAHRDHGLQERARYPLALARGLALQQGNQDANGAVQAGAHVGDGDAGPHRPAARHAGDPHQAAHALGNLVEARALGIGTVLAEARDRAQHDARIHFLQALVVDAQSELHVGAVILDHHVGLLDQLHEDGLAVRLLQVERDRALVAVQVLEVRPMARPAHIHIAGARRHLDLDAVGAPVGEIAHGGRAGAHPRQIEHGKTGKRSCGHGLTLGWEDYSTRTMAAGSISSQTRLPISKTVPGPVETRSGLAAPSGLT